MPPVRLLALLAAGLTAGCAVRVTRGASLTAPQREELMAPIRRMVDGMRTRDSALMASAFTRDARLYGMRSRADGSELVQVLTAEQFIAFMLRDQRGPWIERVFEPEFRVDGTLATVWGAYDFHFGATFSHCGIDAFSLLRTPDGWRIAAIADTYVREGCPRREPPALLPG